MLPINILDQAIDTVNEAGMSRRDFLKKSAAGALTLSPLGKLLTSVGIPPTAVENILTNGYVKFAVCTGSFYGRGDVPDLDTQFDKVNLAAKIARFRDKDIGYANDVDSYFVGKMTPQDFAAIAKASKSESPEVNIAGLSFNIYDKDENYYLENDDTGLSLNIHKTGEINWLECDPVVDNPIRTWWNGFGKYSNETITPEAKEIMDRLGLEEREDYENVEDDNEYEDEYENEDGEPETDNSPKWRREEAASSMHQWYESKLEKAINSINEAGMSRRDFLKKSAVGALAMSPLGKLLTSVGIQPIEAEKILTQGYVPLNVWTFTYSERDGILDLDEQFDKVALAAKVARFRDNEIKFGIDEDAYFVGKMSPQDFATITAASQDPSKTINIKGVDFKISEDDYKYYLINDATQITMTVPKSLDTPMQKGWIDVEENPIKLWYNEYGYTGKDIITPKAKKMMNELGFEEKRDEYDQEYEEEPEEYEEEPQDDYSPKWRREEAASPMHQWYESKLNKAIDALIKD